TLIAPKAGSLKKGSPVFYKQIEVGEVLSTYWDSPSQKLKLRIFIREAYAKEVHPNTLFYNASGINAKIGLNSLSIAMESLETIIAGGISFFTPSSYKQKPVKNNSSFTLYNTKEEASNTYFTIKFLAKDSFGLKVGSTLTYKKVVLGQVEKIDLQDEDVLLEVQVDTRYKKLINKETIFWLEGFEIGFGGVKNPSAAISGPSITLKPGYSTQKTQRFILNPKSPPPHFKEEGLRINLSADRLGGLKENTPLYFRQIQIGSVISYTLNANSTALNIEVFINPCYAHLIRKNSYFYNASGIGMDISIFGAKLKTETLESIITGGIGVLTPDDYLQKAQDEDHFKLNEDFDEDALDWKPKLISDKENCS
ncbi:MCE family protein, partial [Sulfurimonas sp. MAG313]